MLPSDFEKPLRLQRQRVMVGQRFVFASLCLYVASSMHRIIRNRKNVMDRKEGNPSLSSKLE
jgi:hypothetical protein